MPGFGIPPSADQIAWDAKRAKMNKGKLRLRKARTTARAAVGITGSVGLKNYDMDVDPSPIKYFGFSGEALDHHSPKRCSSCGDINPHVFQCTRPGCTYAVCAERSKGTKGCIQAINGEILSRAEFICPACLHRSKSPFPYNIDAYAFTRLRRDAKIVPTCLYTMRFSRETAYVRDSFKNHFNEVFHGARKYFFCADTNIHDKAAERAAVDRNVQPMIDWFWRNNGPIHFLAVLDSHSDTTTGHIAHSVRNGELIVSPVSTIIDIYLGSKLSKALPHIQGFRGLFLLTCGSAFECNEHMKNIKSLVSKDKFDFVIGFTGPAVVPAIIMPEALVFINALFNETDKNKLWSTALHYLPSPYSGQTTPTIFIFETGGEVVARQFVYSVCPAAPWGMQHGCPNPNCNGRSCDLDAHPVSRKENHALIKFSCNICKTKTPPIPRPQWLHQTDRRFCFWHEYPLSEKEREYVKENAAASASNQ